MHKYTKTWSLGDIQSTTVYPSSRISDRVPFGTGKAVNDFITSEQKEYKSHDPRSFLVLGEWIYVVMDILRKEESNIIPTSADIDLQLYLESIDYKDSISQLIKSTKSSMIRIMRFFAWFDAFKLMKYLHYTRDRNRPDISIDKCLEAWSELSKVKLGTNRMQTLEIVRKYDRLSDYRKEWRGYIIKNT